MTSEEIIQRLLDEKKITVKEAMIILKDLAKIGIRQVFPKKFEPIIPNKPMPQEHVVVMYGVTMNPITYNNDDTIISSGTTISGTTITYTGKNDIKG